MALNAYALVPMWLIVAMATAAAILPAPRTSPSSVAPLAVAEADPRPAWQIALDTMDRCLAAGDISGAEIAWRNAYGLAIRSRQWQAFLAAGDGSLRMSDHVLVKRPYRARAGEAWRAALFLARAQHSVDGVLRVAERFARLGDAEALTQALRIADSLAKADATGEAERHVLEVRRRLTPSTALADPVIALFPDAAVGP